MAYTVSGELELRVKTWVSSGEFASEDEVLRSALDALERQRAESASASADLAAIRQGLADYEAGDYQTLAEFDGEMRRDYPFLGDE